MNPLFKLGGFLLALVAAFAVSFLVGTRATTLIDPVVEHSEGAMVSGQESSQDGYTLKLAHSTTAPGTQTVDFQLTGPEGKTVGALRPVDGSTVHLIAVRRDLTGYQHRTPASAEEDSWQSRLDLTPGPWRLWVSFWPQAAAQELVLGVELDVTGEFAPQTLPPISSTAAVDGYTVQLEGELRTDERSALTAVISRDGRPITDLQPQPDFYVRAVAIRAADFGYVHLHADQATTPGPDLPIRGSAPSAASYRLFIEFMHRGVVHAAAFTVEAQS